MSLSDEQVKQLDQTANDIRMSILDMLAYAGSGHTAGPLDMADIFTVLYFHHLRHDSQNPSWIDRDRLVLSNGHICPVLYATMAHAGYFPISELSTLRKFGSRLQGHPHREFLPYVETSSGPLGSGLSQAVGMAIGLRMDAARQNVYCLLGDGELDEGQNWEAIMMAGREKLANLTAIVDRNNIQIDGSTESVMPLEPLADKWRAFNWHVIEINGHDMREIANALETADAIVEKPVVIIAHTIASRGITEIEYDYHWHGNPPSRDQADRWIAKLRTLSDNITEPHID
jgi:transketolase